jgi:hypothetical protein
VLLEARRRLPERPRRRKGIVIGNGSERLRFTTRQPHLAWGVDRAENDSWLAIAPIHAHRYQSPENSANITLFGLRDLAFVAVIASILLPTPAASNRRACLEQGSRERLAPV